MTPAPDIMFLSFPGCPNAVAAREVLVQGLRAIGLNGGEFTDINTEADDCPEHLRCWASPSIVINGEDVDGHEPGSAAACRIYAGFEGAPDAGVVVRALARAFGVSEGGRS